MLGVSLSLCRPVYTCFVLPAVGHFRTALCNRGLDQCPHSMQRLQSARLIHMTAIDMLLHKDHHGKKSSTDIADQSRQLDTEEEGGVYEFVPGTFFPNAETLNMIVDGVPYSELHVANIRSTKNNTIITINQHNGLGVITASGGTVGFRNAKKGTNIAGQAAGISAGEKSLSKGINTVRVIIKGIGPGRLASIKGLQMGGLNIASITDNTPTPSNTGRPRKQRRL